MIPLKDDMPAAPRPLVTGARIGLSAGMGRSLTASARIRSLAAPA